LSKPSNALDERANDLEQLVKRDFGFVGLVDSCRSLRVCRQC